MDNEECPICLLPFENESTIVALQCRHQYCSSCFLIYKGSKNLSALTCPTCRGKIDLAYLPAEYFTPVDAPSIAILEIILKRHNYDENYLLNYKKDAIEMAMKNHRLDIFKWWYDRFVFTKEQHDCHIMQATGRNNIEVLRFLKSITSHKIFKSCAQRIVPYFLIDNWYNEDDTEDYDHTTTFANLSCDTLSFWFENQAFQHVKKEKIAQILNYFTIKNRLPQLQWWKEKNLPICFFGNCLNTRNIEILKWWKLNLPKLFESLAVSYIVDKSLDVELMDWLKHNVSTFHCTSSAINLACSNNAMDMLDWWANSGLDLKIDEEAFRITENVEVLDWLAHHANSLVLRNVLGGLMHEACGSGDLKIMEWCEDKSRMMGNILFPKDCVDGLVNHGNLDLLKWWHAKGLEFRFSPYALDLAIRQGKFEILNWWKCMGLEFQHWSTIIVDVFYSQRIDIAIWLLDNIPRDKLLMKTTPDMMHDMVIDKDIFKKLSEHYFFCSDEQTIDEGRS